MSGRGAGPAHLWSLGVCLYAAVEGWSPFRRTTLESTLAAILSGEPPEPQQAGPLGPLIIRLLAKDPAERPDADEVVVALEAVAEGWPVPRGDLWVPQDASMLRELRTTRGRTSRRARHVGHAPHVGRRAHSRSSEPQIARAAQQLSRPAVRAAESSKPPPAQPETTTRPRRPPPPREPLPPSASPRPSPVPHRRKPGPTPSPYRPSPSPSARAAPTVSWPDPSPEPSSSRGCLARDLAQR